MRVISILIIACRMFLFGWLLCIVRCLIWVFKRYRTLEQSLSIWVGSSWYVVSRSCRVWCMAIFSTHSMFCNRGSLFAIFRSLKGL